MKRSWYHHLQWDFRKNMSGQHSERNEAGGGGEFGSSRTGAAPYDVVLRPPFPNMEIVRWAPKPGGRTKLSLGEDMHWYTKDNRRLYVLQKVATKLWPKKVAVEVDVLFTVPSELLKKYDSSHCRAICRTGRVCSLSKHFNMALGTCCDKFKWHDEYGSGKSCFQAT